MRGILLDVGCPILAEEGLRTGSTNVTSERVFDRLEADTGQRITNASVIRRLWDTEADYRSDVLMEAVQESTRPEAVTAIDSIESESGSLDLTTPGGRGDAVQEVCRTGGNESTRAVACSETCQLWISVLAMAIGTMSSEHQEEEVRTALALGYEDVTAYWGHQFTVLIDVLGLQLRAPSTMDELVQAVFANSESCALRQKAAGSAAVVLRPTGPDGEAHQWTLFAVGLEGLVHPFLQAVPAAAGWHEVAGSMPRRTRPVDPDPTTTSRPAGRPVVSGGARRVRVRVVAIPFALALTLGGCGTGSQAPVHVHVHVHYSPTPHKVVMMR